MITVTVSENGYAKLQALVAQQTKKAQKFGIATPIMTLTETVMRQDLETGMYYRVHTVEVNQPETVILNGWCLAAVLDTSMAAGTVVRKLPGFSGDIPRRFFTSGTYCDHCNKIRRRNDVYVVYHSQSGEWRQVGSSCLRDFLGHPNAEQIAAFLDGMERDLQKEIKDDYYGGGERCVECSLFLAHVCAVINSYGYVASKAAELTGDLSTKRRSITNYENMYREIKPSTYVEPTATHFEKAEKALEWAKHYFSAIPLVQRSEYENNLAVILTETYITERQLGYVASVVSAYDRYVQKTLSNKDAGQFVGLIGEKISITGTVVRILEFCSAYGMTYMHVFQSGSNVIVWTTNKIIGSVGATVTLNGTVKAHKVYNGTNQTELTRCKVL